MPLKRTRYDIHDLGLKEIIITAIGLILAIFALVFAVSYNFIFEYMMSQQMAIRPNSSVYEAWKSPPININLDIYFFNWTNPENITDKDVKPILEEIGPYRFIDKPDKTRITWNPENHTVSFRRKHVYQFDEENSKGRLDDLITTVNMVALSAGAKAINWKFFSQTAVSIGLNAYGQKVAITKHANELLFDGFQDDMIDAAKEFPILGEDVSVPFDRAGWFYPRNNSDNLTGYYNIYTGEDNIRKIGQMHTWNYKNHTGFFESTCGMINGSSGEFYPTNLQKTDSIEFFNPDLCRTVAFDYEDTVNIHGVEAYKFTGGQKSVDNGTLYPENKCFCNGECVPSGVMNISACRFGAPVFMSYPHFYQADPFYINQVEGMKPSKEKHEFYMILEPMTGVALEVAARFQINLLIRPIPNVALFKNVNRVFVPILWFEQKVKLDEKVAEQLKMLHTVYKAGLIITGIIFAIGLIMIFWYPINKCLFRRNRTSNNMTTNMIPPTLTNLQKSKPVYETSISSVSESERSPVSIPEKPVYPEASPLLEKTGKNFKDVVFINTTTTTFNPYPEPSAPVINDKKEKL